MGDSATTSTASEMEMMVKISASDGVPKLFCPVCNKALTSLQGYVKHVKKHEPPGGFMCRFCSARFCSEDELKKHRDTHHTTIACRLCKDTFFLNEADYRDHIRDVHQGVDRELYKCEKCGAAYKTLEPYRRHIETDCGAIKPFKCDKCPMAFMTKYNLKAHLDNHSGELKFCCSYCGRNFKQKARLVEHERTHTGEKPYKCDVCGKSFSHRESIVTHSSLHTGIRLVECKCCNSRFSCYSNLIKHRRNRPDTCGRPEYDPPRNRIRKHTSRTVLNPNSEIKVVNVNKIIKPEDLEKVQALKKESHDKAKEKPTARKRTGGGPKEAGKRRPAKKMIPKKAIIEFEDSDDDDDEEFIWEDKAKNVKENDEEDDDDDEKPLKELFIKTRPTRQCKLKNINQNESDNEAGDTSVEDTNLKLLLPAETKTFNNTSTAWSDNSEDDYIPDFRDEESCDEEYKSSEYPVVFKQETNEDTTEIEIEAINDLEFQSLPIDAKAIKSEMEDASIFSEKDKILASLLNESDYSRLNKEGGTEQSNKHNSSNSTTTKQLSDNEEFILEETEVVLVKNEDSDDEEFPMEDILDVKSEFLPITNNTVEQKCYVLLEDITNRYPQLKTQSTIKVPRNCQPFFSKSLDNKRRTRKPRGGRKSPKTPNEEDEEPSNTEKRKRKTKLTAEQLKERMRLLKKRDKTYQCPDCIKMYYMRKPFEKHLRDDHKKNDDEIKELIKDEIEELPTEGVYKCHICDKIYLMEKRLQDHIPKHGPEGNLIHKCPCYCVLYFATREEAQAHAHEVHKDLLWCEICEKFMTGSDALKSHKMRIHGTKEVQFKRNLVCDKCGKKFLGRTQLMDHVRSDCGRLPIYQCQVCGKCLTTAGILKTHMLLHQDDRPYQCDKCGKSFKIKAQYKTHIKYGHSDEKRFKCHLCPKAYPYRESLLTHMAVHTGIKRFLCNGCGKRFTCVSNLQAHRKVHSDTCGLLPLNAKATQYMGVQKGNLLLGAKPEPGLDYVESQTLVAKEVFTQDVQATPEDVVRGMQPSNSLSAGLPLNCSSDIILM
ncbi:zinc finger protein 30C isoform X2 [Musca autumnalis]|uniref:zinc finger protein 30C isoform X2 n=1 Tax=Musca autumnalis TaxID=221902 RepID=UPI003CF01642